MVWPSGLHGQKNFLVATPLGDHRKRRHGQLLGVGESEGDLFDNFEKIEHFTSSGSARKGGAGDDKSSGAGARKSGGGVFGGNSGGQDLLGDLWIFHLQSQLWTEYQETPGSPWPQPRSAATGTDVRMACDSTELIDTIKLMMRENKQEPSAVMRLAP